jgi:protein phosphatase
VRHGNEDAVWPSPGPASDSNPPFLIAVADGMGGAPAGEVASGEALAAIVGALADSSAAGPGAITLGFESAYHRLAGIVAANPSTTGMGTTVVLAAFHGESVTVANVGDSRAYRFGGGRVRQVTADHSWVAEEVRAGRLTAEEARSHPYRNVITRVVTGESLAVPDLFQLELAPGEGLLLCSDGLSGVVADAEIGRAIVPGDLARSVVELVALANARGGPDNITVAMAVRVE